MMKNKNIIKSYFWLAACILMIYFLASFPSLIGLSTEPPPITITFFAFFGWVGFIAGGLFHVGSFLLFNYYLVRRQRKNLSLSPVRICLPSLFYIFIITILSILFWSADALKYGLKYQGINYVRFYLLMNIFSLGILTSIIIIQVYRALYKKMVLSSQFMLIYNFSIHASILLFLFPYLGELP